MFQHVARIVVILRMTATRAILEPRRTLILRYQARIFGSPFRNCSANCPRIKRAILLPSLVMDPVGPEHFRSCGIWASGEIVRQASGPRETFDRTNAARQRQATVMADTSCGHQNLCRVANLAWLFVIGSFDNFFHPPEQSAGPKFSIPSRAYQKRRLQQLRSVTSTDANSCISELYEVGQTSVIVLRL